MIRRPRQAARTLVAASASAVALAMLPSLVAASAIDAGKSTVAGSARLNAKGTALQLRGVVHCRACAGFTLGATVSQGGSGAIGEGGVRCVCHSTSERWVVTARTREATAFRAGPARVCVWITARSTGGKAIDARQWCANVRLTFAEV